jgi:hypothetical protein
MDKNTNINDPLELKFTWTQTDTPGSLRESDGDFSGGSAYLVFLFA